MNFQRENETLKLNFNPITINENIPGNYDNYVGIALSHIAKMKNINFNNILDSLIMKENFLNERMDRISHNNKKILLLDLDETLIHADFKEEFFVDYKDWFTRKMKEKDLAIVSLNGDLEDEQALEEMQRQARLKMIVNGTFMSEYKQC